VTTHVSDAAVVDLALGAGTASECAHAGSCEACAERVLEAASALELAQRAEVPEPSPLYWQALRHGVRQRIAEEGQETRRRWAVLVPLAAAAAVLTALWNGPTLPVKGPLAPGLAAWSALPLEEDDDGLRVLEGLALSSDELAGWNRGEGLSAYLANLTDDESRVVAETLRERGQGGES
jgi:ferredoxin